MTLPPLHWSDVAAVLWLASGPMWLVGFDGCRTASLPECRSRRLAGGPSPSALLFSAEFGWYRSLCVVGVCWGLEPVSGAGTASRLLDCSIPEVFRTDLARAITARRAEIRILCLGVGGYRGGLGTLKSVVVVSTTKCVADSDVSQIPTQARP